LFNGFLFLYTFFLTCQAVSLRPIAVACSPHRQVCCDEYDRLANDPNGAVLLFAAFPVILSSWLFYPFTLRDAGIDFLCVLAAGMVFAMAGKR